MFVHLNDIICSVLLQPSHCYHLEINLKLRQQFTLNSIETQKIFKPVAVVMPCNVYLAMQMALTAENTRALNAVSEMTEAQRGLEAGLTKTRKTMFIDPVLQRRQVWLVVGALL